MEKNINEITTEDLTQKDKADVMKLTILEQIFIGFLNVMWFIFEWTVLYEIRLKNAKRRRNRREVKDKIKYFKPIIKESFWGKSVSWEMRDKPLTEEQLQKFK